jgi:hypothetical protein
MKIDPDSKYFKFRACGSLILFQWPKSHSFVRAGRFGVWPFRFTLLITRGPAKDYPSLYPNKRHYHFWRTTKAEHNQLLDQFDTYIDGQIFAAKL